jgi:hypothetical protein
LRKLNVGLCITMSYVMSWALLSAYHVEPRTAGQSGVTWPRNPGYDYVSQVVTVNFDELDSASGGCYVELFTGSKCTGLGYALSVLTYPGGTPVGYATNILNGDFDHKWVRFRLNNLLRPDSIVRGKKLEFKFMRVFPDTLQFYYDTTAGYSRYGQMIAPSVPSLPATAGLAMRVYARLRPVDSTMWGATCFLPDSQKHWSKWSDSMEVTGARWGTFYARWDTIEEDSGAFDFSKFDSNVTLMLNAGIEPVPVLLGTPKWASSRIDTYDLGQGSFVDTSVFAPPVHMDTGTNFWLRYLDTLLTHEDGAIRPADSVHTWSTWNEPNEGCDSFYDGPQSWHGFTGWWRSPSRYYDRLDTNWTYRCSLYVQLCSLAANTIRSHDGHENDRIVVGELGGVENYNADWKLVRGRDWLHMMYATGSAHFWDVISAHPYQTPQVGVFFDPDAFAVYAETLRSIMRENGDWSELWDSEADYGMVNAVTEEQNANGNCSAMISTAAQAGLPGGTYDRYCWFMSCAKMYYGSWCLFNETIYPRAGRFAYRQVLDKLSGKRFNGRVRTGDGGDSLTRMYEFEDPASLRKTWVCWVKGQNVVGSVKLPARLDTAVACSLDYDGNQQPCPVYAEASGWLPRFLRDRPVFITEPDCESLTRPDLVVDSFRVWPEMPRVGMEVIFAVYVTNQGNRATYDTVWYRLLCDSTMFATTPGPGIGIGASDSMRFDHLIVSPLWLGQHLFSAQVNPGQKFVEKAGLDDNGGYSRNRVVGALTGDLMAATSGIHCNSPLSLIKLESHSWAADTTGQTPCDSARLIQWWYGLNDTVVHGGDTTDWFYAKEAVTLDTSWLYLSGQGKYKLFLQVKDSWGESDLIPDTTHQFVVFDTTAPAGSIVVEGGRFASNSTRTLRLAASDSAAGVCDMRFMNRGRANLARNGAFDPAGGCWSFTGSGCGYDTSLQMGRLAVGPTQSTVRQFVSAESISAYSGDSCVLEASILAHVHNGEATGEVSFWHFRTNENPEITDTLWELADSASYTGDLLSLTGRYNIWTRFLLAPPAPESGWAWQGGMVRVRAQGVDGGTGTVWCDGVGMNAYEPQAGGYAWWGQYDSTAQWDIGSTAGQRVVGMCLMDSAGAENAVPYADTVVLDPTPPVVDISLPMIGQLVNGLVEIVGVAYDSVEVPGDSWFSWRSLRYRHWDSTNWLPASPDTISHYPAYPDSMSSQGPAVHLGYWNTLGLDDGIYYLLLTACDSASNTSSCTTWVMVDQGFGGGGMCSGPEGGGTGMGEGSCFVGSAEGRVLHLSDDLTVLDTFSVSDSGSQAYVSSILEVGDDSLLVLDAANKRIHKLHRNGQHRRRLVSGLSQPADLKQDENGNFWLVDRGIHRIGKFRSNGTLVFVRGGLGADSLHFHSPEGIAVKGGLVYVADAGNNRLAVWDTSGHFKTTITGDFENPTAVYVSDAGAIYLTDGTDGKLKGITPLGGNIVTIGTTDSSKLKGLVPSENRHSLFSLASEPNKVYKLRIQSDESRPGGAQSGGRVNLPKTLALNQPFPNPARTRLIIAYALPRQTRVELKLYDVAGKLVSTLANGEQKPGYYNLTWNRQDTKGRSCACGIYFCTLAAENQRFSRKVILTE